MLRVAGEAAFFAHSQHSTDLIGLLSEYHLKYRDLTIPHAYWLIATAKQLLFKSSCWPTVIPLKSYTISSVWVYFLFCYYLTPTS